MTKKDTLVDLLDAEFNRAGALLMMQVSINDEEFEYAMGDQLEYMYWNDECERIRACNNNNDKYWTLRFKVLGLVL